MKKLALTLIALMLSSLMMAGSFVMIPYSSQAELEKIFANKNLTVHYYNDHQVFATTKQFDAETMILLDDNAFAENEVYTIVYCPQAEQNAYEALLQTPNYVVVKGTALPYKNDGAVAIFNKRARLPQPTREFPTVTAVDTRIREMMDQVNMDSLEATVQYLQDYQSRIWNSTNAFSASDWIAGRMAALGLEVEQQAFTASTWMGSGNAAPNVIGIQRGTLYPDTYVVCGSHFDSFSYEAMFGGGDCPGADDNATGVASVLESARILTQYEFEYSIVYCCYGCEEMGLYGSEAYASRCQSEGMDIIGYFNNDMNGYLNPGDDIHIDCIYPNSVAPIGDYYMNVANVYFPEMQVQHVNFNEGDSDHTSFNNHGYMGIYPFEDYQNYSPNIHTPQDLIGPSVNSFAMSQRYCQMNIGCLTEIARPMGGYYEETLTFDVDTLWIPETNEPALLTIYNNTENEEVVLNRIAIEEGEQWYYFSYNGQDFSLGEEVNIVIPRGQSIQLEVHMNIWAKEMLYPVLYFENTLETVSLVTALNWTESVSEQEISEIHVYPNPVENQLTIQAPGLQRVVIYNVMGQQIATIEARQDECAITMGNYPKGLYTLQLVTGKGVVNRNVVVK